MLWDYKLHNQFEISAEYLDELRQVGTDLSPVNQSIFSELVENKIIVSKNDSDYSESEREWDDLAKIFHIGTQDVDTEILPPAEYSEEYLKDCERKISGACNISYAREGEKITLPLLSFVDIENAKLIDTLRARRTSRTFYLG